MRALSYGKVNGKGACAPLVLNDCSAITCAGAPWCETSASCIVTTALVGSVAGGRMFAVPVTLEVFWASAAAGSARSTAAMARVIRERILSILILLWASSHSTVGGFYRPIIHQTWV